MQIRHFVSLAFILLIAILHFAVQWFAWKVHRFEIPLGDSLLAPPADYLWKVCAWPLFHLVSRRIQHLHFLAILIANSLAWGTAFVAAATSVWKFGEKARKRRRKKRADAALQQSPVRTSPPTRVERIIELNSMLNRKRITEEEYRTMRLAIMREHEPEPDSIGSRAVPNAAVNYVVPVDVSGAEHVAWLDETPRGVQKRRDAKRDAGRERNAPPPTRRTVARGR
jgi:hypothetical protein